MDSVFESLLWASLILVAYTFCGYPLLLALWSRLKPQALITRAPITPAVSIVIAAWNEAPRLVARINNCLEQRYPSDRLEIIIVSDGSTDDTFSVVSAFDHRRVRLVQLEKREGKAAALNAGVSTAEGEIVVFADARQRFAPDAVLQLVANFSDSSVGAASGELILEDEPCRGKSVGVGLYWKLEKWIRRKEATIDSVIGATGAIYAIRRALYQPLPPGIILDDVMTPMRIVMSGYRVIFESRAQAYDQLSGDACREFSRKVRTLTGNYQILAQLPDLVNPRRNRLFIQYMSHKVCRLAVPFALILVFLGSLLSREGVALYLLTMQVIGYALAFTGWVFSRIGVRERVTSAAWAFVLLNAAALVGAFRYVAGSHDLWRKTY